MIRGLLAEFGIDISEGLERALGLARQIAAKKVTPDVPQTAMYVLGLLCGQVLDTHVRLQVTDRAILALQRSDEVARRLSTIPGIGPVGATPLAASFADPRQFRRVESSPLGSGSRLGRTRAAAKTGLAV